MRLAQIVNGYIHWIFESDTIPVFPPDQRGQKIPVIDITNHPEVTQGWRLSETGELLPPEESSYDNTI